MMGPCLSHIFRDSYENSMGPRDPIIGAQGIPLLGPKGSHYGAQGIPLWGPRDPIMGPKGSHYWGPRDPIMGPKGSHCAAQGIPLFGAPKNPTNSGGFGKDVGPQAQRTPENGKSRDVSPIASGYLWVVSYNPQESLENTTNTMGITVRGIPNCPLKHGHEPIQRGPQMVENTCKFGWFLQMLFSQT